jgi:C-terminal processing protease CtpA/Prc
VTNWGYADLGEIAYIAIGAWNTNQVRIAAVDSVLELLRDRAGLILDVRANGGGNDALALQVAGRFTTSARVVEYIQFRNGPAHSDFTPLEARTLAPRGPWQYSRPVIVLSGRGVFSSNETFISAMREIPSVIIMGDTTGGSSGNPQEFPLAGGWAYTVPRWIAWTADLQIIEWNGIAPDIHVPATAAEFAAGRDPVLDSAIVHLHAITGTPSPRHGNATETMHEQGESAREARSGHGAVEPEDRRPGGGRARQDRQGRRRVPVAPARARG